MTVINGPWEPKRVQRRSSSLRRKLAWASITLWWVSFAALVTTGVIP